MLVWQDKKTLFEQTALPHLDAVYRFALHLTGNDADAEDLTQDCFHLAYKNFHQFRRGTNCRAWLFRIAKNAYIDRLRRKRREPQKVDFNADLHSPLQDSAQEAHLSERAVEKAMEAPGSIDNEEVFYDLFGDEVNRFLGELPQEFRTALILCDVEGFSYNEIADILGCPIGTVRSRISRARSFLRARLYEYAKSLGYVKCGDCDQGERREV